MASKDKRFFSKGSSVKIENTKLKIGSDGLPEITSDSGVNWIQITASVKKYSNENYKTLSTIFQDPLLLKEPAYEILVEPSAEDYEARIASVDDTAVIIAPAVAAIPADGENPAVAGIPANTVPNQRAVARRSLLTAEYNSKHSAYQKELKKAKEDRSAMYELIRTLTCDELNERMAVDEAFLACGVDDPLTLWGIIKRLVMTKSHGDKDYDRDSALRAWHTLQMTPGETPLAYGKRAQNLFDALSHNGVEEALLPTEKERGMKYINGLTMGVSLYAEYVATLQNYARVFENDMYPTSLTAAVRAVTKYRQTAPPKQYASTLNPNTTTQTMLRAMGHEKPGKGGGKSGSVQEVKGKGFKRDPKPDTKLEGKDNKQPFNGDCRHCGKTGHKWIDCRDRLRGIPPTQIHKGPKSVNYLKSNPPLLPEEDTEGAGFWSQSSFKALVIDDKPVSTPSAYRAKTQTPKVPPTLPANTHHLLPSEAIFDTGTTGTVIAEEELLSRILQCRPVTYNGLNGSMTVTQQGQLKDIGTVHYDKRAGVSIISASECIKNGHSYEYCRGDTIDQDCFLLHTEANTYKFQYKSGLYVCDFSVPPAVRDKKVSYTCSPGVGDRVLPTIMASGLYTTVLPTTTSNEASVTVRQRERAVYARKVQASLGFPSDQKFITMLRAGCILNCDVLPDDVIRATALWGPNLSIIQGKTTQRRPIIPPQNVVRRREHQPQVMHADIMFVNKQAILVSVTLPIGIMQVANVPNLSVPVLRQSIRKMFGVLHQRNIEEVVRFESDNERGIAGLFGDMGAMAVEVITRGPGQHDHVIERGIRTLKECMRCTERSLPYFLPDILVPHLAIASAKKLMLFPTTTRTDMSTPFEEFFNRKPDMKRDIGPPFGSYCQVMNRVTNNSMESRTLGCLYLGPTMNGTGTHQFIKLENKAVIMANQFQVLPITPIVTATVNGWANRNQIPGPTTFTWKDKDIQDWGDEDFETLPAASRQSTTQHQETVNAPAIPNPFPVEPESADQREESPTVVPPVEPRGDEDVDQAGHSESPSSGPGNEGSQEGNTLADTPFPDPENPVSESSDTPNEDIGPPSTEEASDLPELLPAEELQIAEPPPLRKSERIRRAPVRYGHLNIERTCLISIIKAFKLYPGQSREAMISEVRSLLNKGTFLGVHKHKLSQEMQGKILRTIMNAAEKWLPDLTINGNKQLDKIKFRFLR